jgi:hypothetical protein
MDAIEQGELVIVSNERIVIILRTRQNLSAQCFGFYRQPPPLVIVESQLTTTELLTQTRFSS